MMNKPTGSRLFVQTVITLCMTFSANAGAVAQAADKPAGNKPKGSGELDQHQADDLDVQFARMNLRLAQLELQIALQANERLPGTYASTTVQRLRNNVQIAAAQVQWSVAPDDGHLHQVHLREMEGAVTLAELELKSAEAINRRVPGTYSDLQIERFRTAAELAQVALARAASPEAVKSMHAHLQWQLDQLRSEMSRLQIRVEELTKRQ